MTLPAHEATQFDPAAARQMEEIISDLGRMYQERNKALQEVARAHQEALCRLTIAAEYKDADSGVHIVRIGFLAGALAKFLGHRVRQALRIHATLDARNLLARVITFVARRVRVLHALRVHDQQRGLCAAPQSLSGRANLIFTPGSRPFGKSLCNKRHWQPVRNRYSTAQNTSYRSTVVGLGRHRTFCSSGTISSNFSRLMSLAHFFLTPIFSPLAARL